MTDKIIVYPDAGAEESEVHSLRFDRLRSLGEFRLHVGRAKTNEEYIERIREANAVLLGWDLPAEVMREARNLEVVSFTGIGAAKFVDIELARKMGVTVCNCPGYSDNTVAEHALALLLAVAKNIARLDSELRGGAWNQSLDGIELRGKKIGLVGFGGIGARFSEICAALGMRVFAWTRHVTAERLALQHVEFIDLDELYAQCDFISLHLASDESTAGLVGPRAFDTMKRGGVLINTARAELIDEQALLMALSSGRLAAAGLDVFWQEPLPGDHVLNSLPNVVLSPHVGYKTPEATSNLYDIGVENIVRFFAGEPINVVNRR